MFKDYFPIWSQLTAQEQAQLEAGAIRRSVKKGTVVHNGGLECTGLLLVVSGQLRAYMLSSEGREITLYRLFERDMCMLSATCIMSSLQFDITISVEKDAEVYIVAPDVYKALMLRSLPIANYTTELMAARFSEVMWLVEQIMWKSLDRRVAAFLLSESVIEGTNRLSITHETVANHLGTHREVVTRMLKYLSGEGMVSLSRGIVEITDTARLQTLADE